MKTEGRLETTSREPTLNPRIFAMWDRRDFRVQQSKRQEATSGTNPRARGEDKEQKLAANQLPLHLRHGASDARQ